MRDAPGPGIFRSWCHRRIPHGRMWIVYPAPALEQTPLGTQEPGIVQQISGPIDRSTSWEHVKAGLQLDYWPAPC